MSGHSCFESSEEELKVKYRPLFMAIQFTLRTWPGGAADMFRVLDRNVHGSLGRFGIANYTNAPSLLQFLEVLEYTQSRRIAHELADLAHYITLPCATARAAYPTGKAAADALAAPLRKVLYSLDGMAGKPNLNERQVYQADLLRLIDAAHAMYIKLNG